MFYHLHFHFLQDIKKIFFFFLWYIVTGDKKWAENPVQISDNLMHQLISFLEKENCSVFSGIWKAYCFMNCWCQVELLLLSILFISFETWALQMKKKGLFRKSYSWMIIIYFKQSSILNLIKNVYGVQKWVKIKMLKQQFKGKQSCINRKTNTNIKIVMKEFFVYYVVLPCIWILIQG